MKQTDLLYLLQRYQQGECTPEEVRVVEQWYSLLGHQQPPLTLTPAEREQLRTKLWEQIESQTLDAEDLSPPAARPWYAGGVRWAAAAVVALGLGIGAQHWLTQPAPAPTASVTRQAAEWQLFVNTTAQPQTIRLTDGSTVRVSPQGQLKYPRQFAATHRTVYLKGEAFFDIQPDKAHPFRVYTNKVVTTVLGTSFLVRAPEGSAPAVVKVRTGRVRVNPLAEASASVAELPTGVVVLPNQQAVYSPVRHKLQRELVAQPVQLATQSFAFDDRPVPEVLAALQKAYGVNIEYDAAALASCNVTLNLQDASLFAKLDVLCKALGASYEKQDTHILFRSAGCAPR
ncbi:FecR family protein [Hymenobacter wooponensis]|uniref:FecR family protein n=1 Tax=Hymenobacter wooponensis TaxID=1525360 RepID=A0A4Z0MJB9_9BACT|nr:FecR family protein [Hymenobacter wooponensis]TGD79427.1 FecR family protein [Hymenobacter wooponensis]